MWQGVDKRRFPRADYPCKILVKKKAQGERGVATHTENIGVGGVCVILGQALARFIEVELTLFLEDGQLPIDCLGRIVWTVKRQPEVAGAATQVDTGIEFLNLKKKDRLRIEGAVRECLQKQNFRESV